MVAKAKVLEPVTETPEAHSMLDEYLALSAPGVIYDTKLGKLNNGRIDDLLDYISNFCLHRDPATNAVIEDKDGTNTYDAEVYAGHLEVLVRRMFKEIIYLAYFAGVLPPEVNAGYGKTPINDFGVDNYVPEIRKAIAMAFYSSDLTEEKLVNNTYFRAYTDKSITSMEDAMKSVPPSFLESFTDSLYRFATSVYATKT